MPKNSSPINTNGSPPQADASAGGAIPGKLEEAITALAAGSPPPPPPPIVDKRAMGGLQRNAIGGFLVVVTLLLITQLLAIWPAVMAATPISPAEPRAVTTPLLFGLVDITLDPQVALIAMVVLVGALGASIGVSRRFLYFARRDQLTKRDEWSFLIRPVQGAVLALIVYFTLRGGYLGQDQNAAVNPYGIAALSALVGLFTRHAVSKLTDVFDTVFGKPNEEVTVNEPSGAQKSNPA